MEKVEELILKVLRSRGEATTEEIISFMEDLDPEVTAKRVRKALTQLLKEGKIVRIPKPSKMRFVFKILD